MQGKKRKQQLAEKQLRKEKQMRHPSGLSKYALKVRTRKQSQQEGQKSDV